MYHSRLRIGVKAFLILAVLALSALPFMTGCDLLDQILGDIPGGGGTSGALQAVIAAQVKDDLVKRGLNPDLRPPLMYEFSAAGSLDEDGNPISRLYYQVEWNFGDGETRGFQWNDYVTHHRYLAPGTYTVTLTVRETPGYGNAVDTAQTEVTVGPAWLEILGVNYEARPDDQFNVEVRVRNQSNQALARVQVQLLSADGTGVGAIEANLTGETPDNIPPDGTYMVRGVIGGQWTDPLTARAYFCYPIAAGQ